MDYSYLGVGKIYMRIAGAAAALVEIGNASQLDLTPVSDQKELVDYTALGGGLQNSVQRVKSVDLSFIAHDLSPDNLARGLWGGVTPITTAAVTAEAVTARLGGLVRLANVASAVSAVKKGATTFVAGTDYEVRAGGIFIFTAGAIVEADALTVDYTKADADVVQAFVNSSQEYEMVFEGLNEARSGKAVVTDIYRVRLSAAKKISLIGADYAALEITGKVLKDSTKTGTGISQYFKSTLVR
jgi:hypothetical protein